MISPKEVILKNVGVLVLERKDKKKKISYIQKIMIKSLTYMLSFLIIIYKERTRNSMVENMFTTFTSKSKGKNQKISKNLIFSKNFNLFSQSFHVKQRYGRATDPPKAGHF